MSYVPPLTDMQLALAQAGIDRLAELPGYEAATADMVSAILEEAGRFASNVIAPLNRLGDVQGSRLVDGKVEVPEGFSAAYRQYVEAGWMGLAQAPEHGGHGLPFALHMAVSEMWNSACLAFAINPMLTSGAINALRTHASRELADYYLPRLVSGQWTGTMNLTEPQAGSDLSLVKTRAEPAGDHYLITGQKIFISWGDHEMAENIVHLVLARLPDAPPGSAGISLFLVPKYLPGADGSLGPRNDLRAVSLEHKMGIHASPTCVMSFGDDGGAVGYLVGSPNRGLACMFTMMNHARLEVGLSGVALAERAYQQAAAFARERLQGQVPGAEGRAPIIEHGDVRRMLMTMRALAEAGRALAYTAAVTVDLAHHHPDEAERARARRRLDLLTPIVKGWGTEIGEEVASLGIQVHGGMGYVEETGAAQYLRDVRVTQIYEGTNGIQAGDLVNRKLLRDGGAAMSDLLAEIEATIASARQAEATAAIASRLETALGNAHRATELILARANDDVRATGAVSFDYLMLMGTLTGGWKLLEGALAAMHGDAEDAATAKLAMARFYAGQILPRSGAHLAGIEDGGDSALALPAEVL